MSASAGAAPGQPTSRTVARVGNKIDKAVFSNQNKAFLGIAVAGAAYAAMSKSAEAGESKGQQLAAAAKDAGSSLLKGVAITGGIGITERALLTAAPSLAVKGAKGLLTVAKIGVPGLAAVGAAFGAYQGYKASGTIAGAALGAVTGGYVPQSLRKSTPDATPAKGAPAAPTGPMVSAQDRNVSLLSKAAQAIQGQDRASAGQPAGRATQARMPTQTAQTAHRQPAKDKPDTTRSTYETIDHRHVDATPAQQEAWMKRRKTTT